jgi:hypothetical protein
LCSGTKSDLAMSLVRPNKDIERRWNGALKASLAQAPLESFLRANLLEVNPAAHSDNIAQAVVYLASKAIELHLAKTDHGLEEAQHSVLADNACQMAGLLATGIAQPSCWRAAALISTARLLRPWIGFQAAAISSASLVNSFAESQSSRRSTSEQSAGWLLTRILQLEESDMAATVAEYLATRLSRARHCIRDADPQRILTHA